MRKGHLDRTPAAKVTVSYQGRIAVTSLRRLSDFTSRQQALLSRLLRSDGATIPTPARSRRESLALPILERVSQREP